MLPPEIYPIIISFVPQRVSVEWRTVSKLFRIFIDKTSIIPLPKFKHSNPQYQLFPSVYKKRRKEWKEILRSAVKKQDVISLRKNLENKPNAILKYASYIGDVYMMNLALKYEAGDYKGCCNMAAYGNHKEIVIEIISYRDQKIRDGALFHACKGGHKELALFLLEECKCDAEYGARGACKGNKKELLELMIEKGKITHFENIFHNACKNDHLVDLLMAKYIYGCEYNSGLNGACVNGHLHLIKLMINEGADRFDDAFNIVCRNGYAECVSFLFNYVNIINLGFDDACWNGHKEVADLLLLKGAKLTPSYNDYFVTGIWMVSIDAKRKWFGPYKDDI